MESALIELSQLKSEVYFEKQAVEGKLRGLATPPRQRTAVRPHTTNCLNIKEDQDVHQRLVIAENLMRQLYRRNKLIEENMSKPQRDRLDREIQLTKEIREQTEDNELLRQQIADLQQKINLQPADSYVHFLEERFKETSEESKRHLQNYSQTKRLLMANLKASGSDDFAIRELKESLAYEAAAREKERLDYEAELQQVKSW